MSEHERSEFKDQVVIALRPYLLAMFIALTGASFTAGGVWVALNAKVDRVVANDDRQDIATNTRVAEWSTWRRGIEIEVDRHSNRILTIERRPEAPQRTP